MMIFKEGSKAPSFTVLNQGGEKVSLKDFQGKWLILYFYPKDNTPGCTIEAKDFTKLKKEFEKMNAVVVGVSKDSVKSHCSFIEKQELEIELLSDENQEMLEKYHVWGKKKFMGREFMGIIRSTFLIDPESKIRVEWSSVKVKGHAQEVLKKLKELG